MSTAASSRSRSTGRGAALVVALAAVAGAVVVWRRRSAGGGPVRHTGLAARNAALAKVGARTGLSWAGYRARRVFADAGRRAELDHAFELRTAEEVAAALGNMKGALMKLGQMASYLDQGLPDHVREALATLQQDSPPMHPELAAQVIREELGHEPEQVFATWDPVPIASASIGQVHRAMTHDGRPVAVKVQYPGVERAMGADLKNVGLLFGGLGQLFPGFDPEPVVEELRERLVEELDYSMEATNQALFARHYAGHPTIHIPEVVGELSTARVLTTELATGERFDAVCSSWSQDERDLAAETIYRFVFGSLYGLGVFNGDPHPGNYLFRPGGQVTFLDFGLVKHFTAAELLPFETLIRAMVLEPNIAHFRELVEDLGLLKRDQPFSDELVGEYFGHFYELVATPGPTRITPEYASETVRRYFDQSGPYGEIMRAASVPSSFVLIQRINLGLNAVLGELDATADWRALAEELWPFVAATPSTGMGRAIEQWQAARAAVTA